MAAANVLDAFRGDAFSNISLSRLVNKTPFIPQFLGSRGAKIFAPTPILTTGYAVDRLQGSITLVPTSPRGAPATQRKEEKRDSTYFDVPRLAVEAKVRADELQNVRDYNDPTQLMTLQTMIARKLMGPTGLTRQIELTWENMRLGAVQGKILDSDGVTVITNYYTKFGIPVPAAINFDLLNPALYPAGHLRTQLNGLARTMKRAAQGSFIEGQTKIIALVGDNFFDAFINHPDVTETFKNWFAAQQLRENRAFGQFDFGGVEWNNYRGTDDNSTVAVNTNECAFFLQEAPGVFEVAYAPGETFEDVNKPGTPMYVYNLPDPSGKNAFVTFEINSFPLFVCTRPETLQKGLLAAGD